MTSQYSLAIALTLVIAAQATAQSQGTYRMAGYALPPSRQEPIRPGGQLPAPPVLDREREPDQPVVVRERFAGWKQAGTDRGGPPTETPLRANWVLISPIGEIAGRVIGNSDATPAKMPVYLLSGGNVVGTDWTDDNGRFSFANMDEGAYSLIGFGENGFFAFGFNALEHRDSLLGKYRDSILVRCTENKSTINIDWIRHFAPGVSFRVLGRYDSKEGTDDPAELLGFDGLTALAPPAVPATSVAGQDVLLDAAGTLVGRVHQIHPANGRPVEVRNLRVMLLKDDRVVAATNGDNFGVFRFEKIPPGEYSCVAVSNDGLACIGLNAVDGGSGDRPTPADPTSRTPGGPRSGSPDELEAELVAMRMGQGNPGMERIAIDFALTSPDAAGWLNHTAIEEAYLRVVARKIQGTGECQTCEQPFNMCKRRKNPITNLMQTINGAFDTLLYGESPNLDPKEIYGLQDAPPWRPAYGATPIGRGPAPGIGQGNCGNCGGAGCQNCQGDGYGQNWQGQPGTCNECGGAGCPNCQPQYYGPAPGDVPATFEPTPAVGR